MLHIERFKIGGGVPQRAFSGGYIGGEKNCLVYCLLCSMCLQLVALLAVWTQPGDKVICKHFK